MKCCVCSKELSEFEGHEKYLIKCKPCFDEHEVIIGEMDKDIAFVGYPKGDSTPDKQEGEK